jgi:DNA-directed RNA polymerase subunit beta'
MILGCFYLTVNNPTQQKSSNNYFADFEDVLLAYQQLEIELHTFVWVKFEHKIENETSAQFEKIETEKNIFYISNNIQIKNDLQDTTIAKYIRTTPGRILLNQAFNA